MFDPEKDFVLHLCGHVYPLSYVFLAAEIAAGCQERKIHGIKILRALASYLEDNFAVKGALSVEIPSGLKECKDMYEFVTEHKELIHALRMAQFQDSVNREKKENPF